MQSPPNLLFILTDQQRFDTLACYGNHAIETPHLNAFAAKAVVFDEAYCATPVCGPSRGTLLTGLWAHQHGVVNNWEQPLRDTCAALPSRFAAAGQPFDVTGYLGKWHLGMDVIEQCGFDEVVTMPRRAHTTSTAPSPQSYEAYSNELGDKIPHQKRPSEHSMPGFLATRAIDFIERNSTKRWMLQVSFDQPHPPYRSCRDGTVDPDTLPVPENFLLNPTAGQPDFLRDKIASLVKNPAEGCDLGTEAGWRELMACYWGNMANVDFHVGRLLEALESTGQLDNTLIIFTSDHGEMMGSHKLLQKAVMFQEAVRVPMLIRLPGQNSAGRINGPISQIDLVPTLLDLCGAKIDISALPGRSLAELCIQAAADGKHPISSGGSPIFIQWHASRINPVNKQACKVHARTVITSEKEKYTCYADGQEELYLLASDPIEMRNLASDPGHAPTVSKLRRRLSEWQREVSDLTLFPQLAVPVPHAS